LERELARLLGSLLKIEPAGEAVYYAVANFAQRIDLIEAMIVASLEPGKPLDAARALFTKIRRLWKSRNYLIHSHYVYAKFDHHGNFLGGFIVEGRTLGPHPRHKGTARVKVFRRGVEIPQIPVASHGFAYVKHNPDGTTTHVPVNRGTFGNHADQLSKRSRQVQLLTKAIQTMAAPLKWGSFSDTSHTKCSPRADRNRRKYQELLERRKARPSPPESSPR
jgi:hypothetical protein